jgi:hypothetical protein
MVATCIDIMRTATEQHNGTVIKTMGDEVMSTFPTVDDALNAAGQMQQAIQTHPDLKVDGQPVSIRIGCHYGPVVLENRDIFGAAVHTANRMTSQAKAGQIITTATMVDQLSPEWRARWAVGSLLVHAALLGFAALGPRRAPPGEGAAPQLQQPAEVDIVVDDAPLEVTAAPVPEQASAERGHARSGAAVHSSAPFRAKATPVAPRDANTRNACASLENGRNTSKSSNDSRWIATGTGYSGVAG